MQDDCQNHLFDVAGLVTADDSVETCPVCSRSMYVPKTARRNGRPCRDLFRRIDIRQDIRAFVRRLGHCLGKRIHAARVDIRTWQDQPLQDIEIPEGTAGIAVVRAPARWILDFSADGKNEGFPFDLPYLDLYVRCLHIRWALDGFLRKEPADTKVKKFLAHLQKILAPMDCDVRPFAEIA